MKWLDVDERVRFRLVYSADPAFSFVNTRLPTQRERMKALKMAMMEMATTSAEVRIHQAYCLELPTATRYDVDPGGDVLVYLPNEKDWVGPLSAVKLVDTEVSVDWDEMEKHLSVTYVILMPEKLGEEDLKRLWYWITQLNSIRLPAMLVTETIHQADSYWRSGIFVEAKGRKRLDLAERGVFMVLCRENVPSEAHIFESRFELAVKNVITDKEVYKTRFVLQWFTDIKKISWYKTAPTYIRDLCAF